MSNHTKRSKTDVKPLVIRIVCMALAVLMVLSVLLTTLWN